MKQTLTVLVTVEDGEMVTVDGVEVSDVTIRPLLGGS